MLVERGKPTVRVPRTHRPAIVFEVVARDSVRSCSLVLEVTQLEFPETWICAEMGHQRSRVGRVRGSSLGEEVPQLAMVPAANVVPCNGVVEGSFPPIEHGLSALRRRLGARIGRRRVIVVEKGQEVEIEIGGVAQEGTPGAEVRSACEPHLLLQHVAELGCAVAVALGGEREAVCEQQGLERALIGAPDVAE